MDDFGVRTSMVIMYFLVPAWDLLEELVRDSSVVKWVLEHGIHVDELVLLLWLTLAHSDIHLIGTSSYQAIVA